MTRQYKFDTFLFAALGISLLFLLLVLIEPLGADNAVLHSMALDLVRYGRIPYIGTWDNNFPGIIFLHAIGIWFFGESGISFRIFDIILQLSFVAFFYQFLNRWLSPHTAALAVVLYAAYYVSGGTYLYGQQDSYGMMLVLIGTALLIPREPDAAPNILHILIGGVIAGTSLVMRPTFALYIAVMGLYLFLILHTRPILSRTMFVFIFGLFALLPIAGVLFYYSTIPQGLEAFYTSTIRFNLDVYTKLSGGSFWIEIFRSGLLIPLAITTVVLKTRKRTNIFKLPPSKLVMGLSVVFIISGLFIVLFMGKFWRYQFAPFYMALIPFSAVGIERIMPLAGEELYRHFVMLGTVFLSSFIAYNPVTPLTFSLGLLEHKNPWFMADEARRPSPVYGAKPEQAMLSFLNRSDNRRGTIESCGFDPYLRLDLNRPFVGRYFNFHALAFRTDATNIGRPRYTDYQRKWQEDYVRQLAQTEPRFIILGRKQPFWYIHDVYDDCLHYLPGFDSLLTSNYRFDTAFGGFQIYRYAK